MISKLAAALGKPGILAALLAVVSVAVYAPVGHHEFLNYDDNVYVTENPQIQAGLDGRSLSWALTTFRAANWHPLTWISHILDVQLFGLRPGPHHLTSLALHALNGVLVLLVLHRMTAALWPSALAAALFALHPLNVQSVAWVAERKTLLSALFWWLTIGAYVSYVRRPGPARYGAVLILFVLGLMAKPMGVTLPFVLLLLDVWPLGRLVLPSARGELRRETAANVAEEGGGSSLPVPGRERSGPRDRRSSSRERRGGRGGTRHTRPSLASAAAAEKSASASRSAVAEPSAPGGLAPPRGAIACVLEKAPLFVLSLASCAVTIAAQAAGGAVVSTDVLPVSRRLATAAIAYAGYVARTFWPAGLSIYYPPLQGPTSSPTLWISVMLLAAVSALVWRAARRHRYLGVGWLWYLGTLVPVIGIVQVGAQSMADRYVYLPAIGLSMMIAWGLVGATSALGERWLGALRALAIVGACSAVGLLAAATRREVRFWHDNVALFEHGLRATRDNFRLHGNLGAALAEQGRLDDAIAQYEKALAIHPGNAMALENLGIAVERKGELARAESFYRRAAPLAAPSPVAAARIANRLGALFVRQGRFDEAILAFREAIRLRPDYALASENLRRVLERTGRSRVPGS